ncbi:MAG: patatin-like phospholipase family protein [Candidatus Berkelbacteria bacterium]
MKIGLALSGGGALGIAHIGALEQIEKNKIKIDLISGASVGAIAGALFAAGGTSKIDTLLYELKLNGVFDRKNLIKYSNPDKLLDVVSKFLKYYLPRNIEDLPIKLLIATTDFSTGDTRYIESGDLIDAILASCAIPGVFNARQIGGRSLIDGGMSANLPSEILREQGMDLVIGSSLHKLKYLKEYNKLGNNPGRLFSVMRSIDILKRQLTNYEMKFCDFCFVPPVEDYTIYNVDKIDDIRKRGQKYAETEAIAFLSVIKGKTPVKQNS